METETYILLVSGVLGENKPRCRNMQHHTLAMDGLTKCSGLCPPVLVIGIRLVGKDFLVTGQEESL